MKWRNVLRVSLINEITTGVVEINWSRLLLLLQELVLRYPHSQRSDAVEEERKKEETVEREMRENGLVEKGCDSIFE